MGICLSHGGGQEQKRAGKNLDLVLGHCHFSPQSIVQNKFLCGGREDEYLSNSNTIYELSWKRDSYLHVNILPNACKESINKCVNDKPTL